MEWEWGYVKVLNVEGNCSPFLFSRRTGESESQLLSFLFNVLLSYGIFEISNSGCNFISVKGNHIWLWRLRLSSLSFCLSPFLGISESSRNSISMSCTLRVAFSCVDSMLHSLSLSGWQLVLSSNVTFLLESFFLSFILSHLIKREERCHTEPSRCRHR